MTREHRETELVTELREEFGDTLQHEIPQGLTEQLISKSLEPSQERPTARPLWWIAAALAFVAPLGLLIRAGLDRPQEPPPTSNRSQVAPQTEPYVIRNDGDLILIKQGDQIVSLTGAPR